MKEHKYLLSYQYAEMEDALNQAKTILEYERDTEDVPLDELMNEYKERLDGAYEVTKAFKDMVNLLSRVTGIAACAMRDIKTLEAGQKERYYRSCIRAKEPETDIAKASILLSQMTPAVIERIVLAIYGSFELFQISSLDSMMSDTYPDEF